MACKIPVRKTLADVVGVTPQEPPWGTSLPLGPGDNCWASRPGVCHVPQKRSNVNAKSARSPFTQAAEAQFGTARGERTTGEAHTSRLWSGAAQITAWVERELHTLGQNGPVPQQDRVRILGEAFGRAIEFLPEYRPLFYSYQREIDDFIEKLQEQVRDLLNAEGRLKTIKMESIAFVGEATLRFQQEVRSLREDLEECEKTRDALAHEKATMQGNFSDMKHRADRDKWLAEESHKQNLDILSNLERSEKQVEALRKQERESYGEIAKLHHQVKEQDQRNKVVEAQLNAERLKHNTLVPREEHEALRDQLQAARLRCLELEEMYAVKEKDYQNIVEAYKSISGHDSSGIEARPLTPRPIWTACRGLLDPESLGSMQQGDFLQELVVRLMHSSRTLLAAYGLQAASQKSAVIGKYTRHPLTMPLVGEIFSNAADRLKTPQDSSTAADAWNDQVGSGGTDKNDGFKEDEKWLAPDMEAVTPTLLRHQDKVRNQRFSRKKTLDFLERVLQMRMREGDNVLSRPYLETMMEVLGQELGEEASCFAINILASVRRYAAEPDFLSFLLLLRGHVSDLVVRDNRTLCTEILRIFRTYFESDGSTKVTKEKFFKALREVLPHKDKEHCQELVAYFPPGGPTTLVNYEWLFLDDPYVLSPILYALRLQHLEESLSLSERMEKVVRSCMNGGLVKLEQMEAACKDDSVLAVLQPEEKTSTLRALHAVHIQSGETTSACEKAAMVIVAKGWGNDLSLLADARAHRVQDIVGSTSVINACSKATKWFTAVGVLKDSCNTQLEPNLVTCNALANGKGQDWQRVVHLLLIMSVRFIEADGISCSSLIHCVGSSSLWLEAAILFDESRKTSIICDIVCFNSAMSACDSARKWSHCLEAFEDLNRSHIQTNIMVFNTVLSAYAGMDLWKWTVATLNSLRVRTVAGRDFDPTLVTRSIAMSACTFVGQWAFALHQMSLLKQRPLEIRNASRKAGNAAICGLGISACALGSLWTEAVSLCFNASAHGKVNVRSFNDAIAACGRRGQWQWALWILWLLSLADRNVVTYTAAMTACGQSQQWQSALQVFSAMKSSDLEVGIISYNSIISALSTSAKWQESFQLLEELQMRRLTPDLVTFGASVNACGSVGLWEEALHLIANFCKEHHQPEAVTFTAAIDACGVASQWQRGLVLLSKLGKDVIAYNTAINACGDVAEWQSALMLLQDVKSADMPSVQLVYTSCIAACRQQWQHALDLLAEMKEIKVQPNLFAYNAALGACDQAGKWLEAIFLFQDLRKQDLEADMISFCTALGACRTGHWHFALPFSKGLRDQLLELLDFS